MNKPHLPTAPADCQRQPFLRDLEALEQALLPNSGVDLRVLRKSLDMVSNDVARRFRLEEQGGYMSKVKKPEPGFETKRQQLLAEHGDLQQDIAMLVMEANASVEVDTLLRDKIQAWIDEMRRHETQETDFVQDAVDLDVGGEA